MKKITLDDIRAWMAAHLAETKDVVLRDHIVALARLQAFYLGALDEYAELTKESQTEFWKAQRQYGYEYKVGRLPEWGNPSADDLSSLENAYSQGEFEGAVAAEEYGSIILPCLAREADKESILINDVPGVKTYLYKEAYARAKRRAEELWRRYHSDERGWGENWWED